MTTENNHIKFIDRPCGSGKTNDLLQSFDPLKSYFLVVPTRDEIDRCLNDAKVKFYTPESEIYLDADENKRESLKIGLKELMDERVNIVCTHKLFDMINMRDHSLQEYHLIIDEVFDCVRYAFGPAKDDFDRVYLEDGLAKVDDDGRVQPTEKWVLQGDGAYKHELLRTPEQ